LAYRGAEDVILSREDDIYFGGNLSGFLGQSLGQFLGESNHPGFGKITGGGGDDILIYYGASHYDAGEAIAGTKLSAGLEFSLTLDGGKDDDWIIALGGEKAIVAGGLGRDWIVNSSKDGESWGDYAIGVSSDGQRADDSRDNSDMFWYFPDTKIMDAQHHDFLSFFGVPMTGGDAAASIVPLALGMGTGNIKISSTVVGLFNTAAFIAGNKIYFDNLIPFITYKMDGEDLLIGNIFDGFFRSVTGQPGIYNVKDADGDGTLDVRGVMRIKNFDFASSYWGYEQFDLGNEPGEGGMPAGTMNMVFKKGNPVLGYLALVTAVLPPTMITAASYIQALVLPTFDALLVLLAAKRRAAKAIGWASDADPLVIDLDGDGIETIAQNDSKVYFDLDNDLFAEHSGWLKGDDGFLVLDSNGNGQIDDITEMFGARLGGGYADLASYDANLDLAINDADPIWAALRIWQDKDGDGITDNGELNSLDQLGIASISLAKDPLATITPQGVQLIGRSTVSFADGTTSRMFEALLPASDIDTRYAGESGRPAWLADLAIDSKGFGSIANLAVAMANDVEFSQLVTSRVETMAIPKLKLLVEQVGDVLGTWGQTMETTRELTPVRVGSDAQGKAVLLDRGVYVEDFVGGYWTLASGDSVRTIDGQPIARATLNDLLAMGGGWRLEQTWSPQTRATPLRNRAEAPYLVTRVDGRAVILDYGIKNADGSWYLASGRAVLNAQGTAIAAPSVADVLAQAHPTGQEWRLESFGFNPLTSLPVDAIGVRFADGIAVDYTVMVTDRDGSFYIWACNLDRALELQAKTGDYREFNLRGYEIDFAQLDEVGSTDDSTYRVELLTPAQFHFATSLAGIDFHPEMLTASADEASGLLRYAVRSGQQTGLPGQLYESDIKPMIELVGTVMTEYITVSRRTAVRLALMGGLKEYAQGITYDVKKNGYHATTDRELAPLFEAIFAAAPPNNLNDAALDYLSDWNEILWQIYPEYQMKGDGNLWGSTVAIDQPFIFQMMLPAFENVGIALDIYATAHALSIDETRIRVHSATDAAAAGTSGVDFFYMSAGNQTYDGGYGSDYYFVGKYNGLDLLKDIDRGDVDELRITAFKSTEAKGVRDGQDLILQFGDGSNAVRIQNQFLGELNDYLTNGTQLQSGVDTIIFADGIIWDRTRMALEVVDRARAAGDFDDSYIGSG
jgi:hypothetical protein